MPRAKKPPTSRKHDGNKSDAKTQQVSQAEPDPLAQKLVLGRRMAAPKVGFQPGFQVGGQPSPPEPEPTEELITYSGDAHLCTVAPTRSGKGVGVVIPNLLTYTGPVVVFDPKGENYRVTARRRREMGQRVIKLDPFGVIESASDGLNPLDLFDLSGVDCDSEAQALAQLLSRGITGRKEPFWDISGTAFSSGLIALGATQGDPHHRNLNYVLNKLTSDDVVHNLAVILDTIGKRISPLAYREIAAVLQMPDITRGGVIATTQTYYKPLATSRVASCLEKSTFALQDVIDGEPLSIYLILPPNRLHSHAGLLKLWIGTLLTAIFTRKSEPPLRTLFILDEAAQLEAFPLLETLLTLSAGYGVWVHTFWQDLSQLRSCFPETWKTILNNCAAIQTFGFYNRDIATQWGDYMDHGVHQLRSFKPDEQILSIHGQPELRCRRLNYLTDEQFAGQFDSNQMYTRTTAKRKTIAKER